VPESPETRVTGGHSRRSHYPPDLGARPGAGLPLVAEGTGERLAEPVAFVAQFPDLLVCGFEAAQKRAG